MLPKIHRATSAEIILAREKGKFIPGRLFSCLVYDLKDGRAARFAFIVSTKINKRAVKRNRIRRQLKESVRMLLAEIKKGKLVLFLVKREMLDKDLGTVKEEVERLFKRSGLTH